MKSNNISHAYLNDFRRRRRRRRRFFR